MCARSVRHIAWQLAAAATLLVSPPGARLNYARAGDVQTPSPIQARSASEADPRGTLACASGLCGPCAVQARALEVRLKDGSTRSGAVHRSTDSSALRLQHGEPNAYIIFRIDWARIAQIRDGEQVWTPERFDAFRRELADRPSNEPDPATPEDWFVRLGRLDPQPAVQEPAVEPHPARVHAIGVDAEVGNWDADVEWDGVRVRVRPIDQWGGTVRAAGRLDVTLTARLDPAATASARGRSEPTIERIGHWTPSLRQDDYGLDGALVRLAFQNYDPDRPNAAWHRDHGISWLGELSVRLVVPGQGVFHAAAGPVRLRRFSPLRDQHFIRHGTRYFPHE